jgi:hypothetical protein
MSGKTTHVRQSLHAALEAIRNEVKMRNLWIDALCINQKDVHERNKQVAIMGKIFHYASKVLVWLGEAADDSDLVFDYMKSLDNEDCEWDGPLNSKSAEAILAFYCRPYWRRFWVIQEILGAIPLDIFCGTKCVPMDTCRSIPVFFLKKLEEHTKDGNSPPWLTEALQNNILKAPGCVILRQQYHGKPKISRSLGS